jgi:hypothetical protein
MEINAAALRDKPQINWQTPYEWMSKLTNEEILQWESEALDEAYKRIKSEGRPPSADPIHQDQKFREESKARVRDLARLIEIEYKKVIQ